MKNLILITLDCVRPEAISSYPERFLSSCYPRFLRWVRHLLKPRTPAIDKLAKEGVRFTQAIAQAPYTPASLRS